MPSVRRLRSRQAPMKKGHAEYTTTGMVRIRLAQLISSRISALMSVAMYDGSAYIITCIMPRPAMASRLIAVLRSRL